MMKTEVLYTSYITENHSKLFENTFRVRVTVFNATINNISVI